MVDALGLDDEPPAGTVTERREQTGSRDQRLARNGVLELVSWVHHRVSSRIGLRRQSASAACEPRRPQVVTHVQPSVDLHTTGVLTPVHLHATRKLAGERRIRVAKYVSYCLRRMRSLSGVVSMCGAMLNRKPGAVRSKETVGLIIRPLRHGDCATVVAVFEGLGLRSRAQRFGGAKPRLSEAELCSLARVDATHHALVAWVDGDPRPAGLGQLVREGDCAEIALAVVDRHQRRGVGSALARELAAVARAAGITYLRATVRDSPGALRLLTRCARLVEERFAAGEREVVFVP